MAELFVNQAKQYAETRPSYPQQLFQFIASKTPTHDLVWDCGHRKPNKIRKHSLMNFQEGFIFLDEKEIESLVAVSLVQFAFSHHYKRKGWAPGSETSN
ncbi:hypothetical protein DKX38_023701 [Salix brachista]|uniref:Uncharacterized protein n=1 Tax=Salix brachista TaxID=2182728 RepID=A0A5N5JKI4_9ROSI|nr:hypothetical protein DKX38_023701 [Salix brachista]